jgi:hypothetical protein
MLLISTVTITVFRSCSRPNPRQRLPILGRTFTSDQSVATPHGSHGDEPFLRKKALQRPFTNAVGPPLFGSHPCGFAKLDQAAFRACACGSGQAA